MSVVPARVMPPEAPAGSIDLPLKLLAGTTSPLKQLVGCAAPVIDRRQRLAGPARIRRRFVPAHAGNRIVVLSGEVRAHLPRRGARPPGGVAELGHRGIERQGPAVFQEWLPPQLRAPVSAVVHEPLERAVRDLVAIDPVVRQGNFGKMFKAGYRNLERLACRGDPYHASRNLVRGEEREVDARLPRTGQGPRLPPSRGPPSRLSSAAGRVAR